MTMKFKTKEELLKEGYQCWETTSEGSPISPVFKTFDELCEWLANNPSGVTRKLSKEDWKKALESDCPVTEIGTGKLRLPPKNDYNEE